MLLQRRATASRALRNAMRASTFDSSDAKHGEYTPDSSLVVTGAVVRVALKPEVASSAANTDACQFRQSKGECDVIGSLIQQIILTVLCISSAGVFSQLRDVKTYNQSNVWIHPLTSELLLQRERLDFPCTNHNNINNIVSFLETFQHVSYATTAHQYLHQLLMTS